jgi:ribose transport system substrate-binding protein
MGIQRTSDAVRSRFPARARVTLVAISAIVVCVLVSAGAGSASSGRASFAQPKPGIFCGAACKKALTLGVDPKTISGKVGLSLNSTAFSYGVGMKNEGQDEAKRYFPKMKLIVTDGQGSVQKQSADVDNLISLGVKVLLISPYQADSLVPAIKRAQAAGIKVITVDRAANTPTVSFISSDDVVNGQNLGNYVSTLLHGKARVIHITGTPGASPTIARLKGFEKAMKKHPGLKIVASANGDYSITTALSVMSDLLQKYPVGSFDAIYADSDSMVQGIAQAMREAGRSMVPVVSINAEKAGLAMIKKGDLTATEAYSTVAREGVIAAAKLLAGEKIPARIKMDSVLITKKNVAKYDGKVSW